MNVLVFYQKLLMVIQNLQKKFLIIHQRFIIKLKDIHYSINSKSHQFRLKIIRSQRGGELITITLMKWRDFQLLKNYLLQMISKIDIGLMSVGINLMKQEKVGINIQNLAQILGISLNQKKKRELKASLVRNLKQICFNIRILFSIILTLSGIVEAPWEQVEDPVVRH